MARRSVVTFTRLLPVRADEEAGVDGVQQRAEQVHSGTGDREEESPVEVGHRAGVRPRHPTEHLREQVAAIGVHSEHHDGRGHRAGCNAEPQHIGALQARNPADGGREGGGGGGGAVWGGGGGGVMENLLEKYPPLGKLL